MKKNFLYQTLYQITSMIIPIITVPIINRAFGSAGVGIWNFVFSIVSYFTLLAGLGLANYGTREIAIVSDDRISRSKKFWELETFNIAFVLLTVIVYVIIVSFFLPYKKYFLILTFAISGTAFDISWFFLGMSDFKRISFINTFIKLLTFILILIFVKSQSDFSNYVWIQSLSIFFSQVIFIFFLKSKIDIIVPSRKKVLDHLKPALIFFLGKVSSTLFNNLNKTLLGIFSTMSVVGIYSNSLLLVLISGGVLNSLNAVMIPFMSKRYSKENNLKIFFQGLEKSMTFQFYLAIGMFFGIITINKSLISWFFGSEFQQMQSVVPLLAVTVIFQAFYNSIATQYLIPRNEMRVFNNSVILGIISSIVVSMILIPFIGIYGAVFSYIFGQFIISMLRYHSLNRSGFNFNINPILYFTFSGIVMFFGATVISFSMKNTVFKTVIQILIGAIIYLLMTYKPYLKKVLRTKIIL